MKRRLQWFCSCALLCALLVTAALPAPAAAASTGFSDVPESHWAADSIRRAVDLGLFQGQTPTRFGLGAPMTRGAFVVALCRLFGWEMVTPEAGSYTDNQDKSAWYYSAVETAYANGAITRQTDTFRPREPITREELAVMLVRAMGYGTIAGLAQDLPMPFRDVTTNVGYIAMAHELGLVNGTAATTAAKCFMATDAVENGAEEVDMVINLGWVKDQKWDDLLAEIKAVKAACKGRLLKVIIECCFLTDEEKIKMCEIVTASGAEYIKTSTGFGTGGATREDVALFAKHVGPNVKIKAAGGIADLKDAEDFINLGASRLGTSRIVKAVKAMEEK